MNGCTTRCFNLGTNRRHGSRGVQLHFTRHLFPREVQKKLRPRPITLKQDARFESMYKKHIAVHGSLRHVRGTRTHSLIPLCCRNKDTAISWAISKNPQGLACVGQRRGKRKRGLCRAKLSSCKVPPFAAMCKTFPEKQSCYPLATTQSNQIPKSCTWGQRQVYSRGFGGFLLRE